MHGVGVGVLWVGVFWAGRENGACIWLCSVLPDLVLIHQDFKRVLPRLLTLIGTTFPGPYPSREGRERRESECMFRS